MIEHVRLTIEDLKTRLGHGEKRVAEIKQTIRVLLELEGVPMVPLPAEILPPGPLPSLEERAAHAEKDAALLRNKAKAQKAAGKKRKQRRKNVQSSDGRKVHRGTKNPFSPYEGIYNGGVNARGQQRYLANIWRDGKNKGLGTFYIPEEAAAAVQKAKGNKAEARRLLEIARQKAADMAEQAESNPDRPGVGKVTRRTGPHRYPAERRKQNRQPATEAEPGESELASLGGLPPAGHIAVAWVCNKCGHNHLQVEKPKVCERCFENHGFHELK